MKKTSDRGDFPRIMEIALCQQLSSHKGNSWMVHLFEFSIVRLLERTQNVMSLSIMAPRRTQTLAFGAVRDVRFGLKLGQISTNLNLNFKILLATIIRGGNLKDKEAHKKILTLFDNIFFCCEFLRLINLLIYVQKVIALQIYREILNKYRKMAITRQKTVFSIFWQIVFAELLPFVYIYLRFLCKFEDLLQKTQMR